jgi:uncharacterized protein (TIGR02266 family)
LTGGRPVAILALLAVSPSAPVRVRLRYPDLDTFVERFAANVTRGGVFIATRAPRPVGEHFAFEIQISTGVVALAGEGKVIWIKEYDPAQPNKAHGMGVQFVTLSKASKDLLDRMLKAKGAQPATAGRTVSRAYTTLGAQGAAARATGGKPVDTNVDLAAEMGFDDAQLRRALDRAWGPGARPTEDDLQTLLRSEPGEKPTLAQALADLPRVLGQRRRTTGSFRPLEAVAPAANGAANGVNGANGTTNGEVAAGENGVSSHARGDG